MANLFIIAAPSGCGKTSLVKALLKNSSNLCVSVSHTTRKSRPDEVNGINYHFVSVNKFKEMINKNAFVEHAEVFENLYGSSRQLINDSLENNKDVILEIDWQGARQVKLNMPKVTSIFILPPSKDVLLMRLQGRGQDDRQTIMKRMSDAKNQMSHFDEFDYLVINDNFDVALSNLESIIGQSNKDFKHQDFSLEVQSIKHKNLLKKLI
ncbi:guanylate kinase [Candidatus Thioglobus sp. NP1]|uniref:guanylate kinase n=1 Tax=Candidatus Thioglobus sp. NP1 TaxID=2508687 RepID=UPI000DED5E40|nr:guanylate kinase [Candidatus Thioglobus sp. NP1]AXE62231.1 guanylate kinase [Candidatus Thioglobus sp. NP1]